VVHVVSVLVAGITYALTDGRGVISTQVKAEESSPSVQCLVRAVGLVFLLTNYSSYHRRVVDGTRSIIQCQIMSCTSSTGIKNSFGMSSPSPGSHPCHKNRVSPSSRNSLERQRKPGCPSCGKKCTSHQGGEIRTAMQGNELGDSENQTSRPFLRSRRFSTSLRSFSSRIGIDSCPKYAIIFDSASDARTCNYPGRRFRDNDYFRVLSRSVNCFRSLCPRTGITVIPVSLAPPPCGGAKTFFAEYGSLRNEPPIAFFSALQTHRHQLTKRL
jgi:hypothetical protein